MPPRQILITTFGSLGDLHPYLAIGQEMCRRGHHVRLATQRLFRERVEAAGLEFRTLRAATIEEPSADLIEQVFAGPSGVRFLLRDLIAPQIRTAYDDTLLAADGVDLLVAHPITLATPMVAARLKLPWVGTQLAPSGLLSAYDPPVWPGMPRLPRNGLTRTLYRGLFGLAGWQVRGWMRPVDALRRELRLPGRGNPFFDAMQSPSGVLALFSPLLSAPQPDWPARVTATGFPFYDQAPRPNAALETWLAAGSAPLVFTLGSSAVLAPGAFFGASLEAARRLGRRALLVGYAPEGVRTGDLQQGTAGSGGFVDGDPNAFAVPYASYRQIFAHGAVNVHQGGIGTTAEALRAGRPMLVVPFGVDQPDNGARVARLGVGRVLARSRYRAERVAEELRALLEPGYAEQSAAIGAAVRAEDGAARAADALEAVLREAGK